MLKCPRGVNFGLVQALPAPSVSEGRSRSCLCLLSLQEGEEKAEGVLKPGEHEQPLACVSPQVF